MPTPVGGADFVVEHLAQLAALAWRDFSITSPLTEATLHAKQPQPTPAGEASEAAAARQSPLPSFDSSQFPSTCSSLPLVFRCSNVAC